MAATLSITKHPLRVANLVALFALSAVGLFLLLQTFYETPTSAVQSLWTTAGVVGSAVTLWNLWDALVDLRYVRATSYLHPSKMNSDRLRLARDAVRTETIRLAQMLGVAGVGLYILQAAPVITAAQRRQLHIPEWTTASIILTVVLLGIVFGTVVQAILDRMTRIALRAAHDNDVEAHRLRAISAMDTPNG